MFWRKILEFVLFRQSDGRNRRKTETIGKKSTDKTIRIKIMSLSGKAVGLKNGAGFVRIAKTI
jgi:hypothetical protein